MNTIKTFAVATIVTLGSIGATAHAQFVRGDSEFLTSATAVQAPAGTPLTRAQVIADREQARRDGTLVTDFVTGKPLWAVDVSPTQRATPVAAKTRAEVRAEVEQARRDGTLTVSDITGKPFYGVSKRTANREAGAE